MMAYRNATKREISTVESYDKGSTVESLGNIYIYIANWRSRERKFSKYKPTSSQDKTNFFGRKVKTQLYLCER